MSLAQIVNAYDQYPVLALDVAGIPRKWISLERAVFHYAKDQIVWELGENIRILHGGTNRQGERSFLEVPSIIAVKGKDFNPEKFGKVALTNRALFARDLHMCAYCGSVHKADHLSRDHVRPVSRGGLNRWENVVTACKPCNTIKNDRTPDEAGMKLMYVPYAPNHYENMILQNRRILADQMDYLMAGVPKHSRLLVNLKAA